jgi:hypothetical protein
MIDDPDFVTTLLGRLDEPGGGVDFGASGEYTDFHGGPFVNHHERG